jgi:putative transposase
MRKPMPDGWAGRGQVIRLDPTHKQAKEMVCAAGCSRFTFNWLLAEWGRQRRAGLKPTVLKIKKQFNAIKAEQFPWIMESPRDANSQPFADFGVAIRNFFSSCKGERKGKKIGYPKPRKKGKDDSFYVANDKFSVRPRGKKRGTVRLPVIGDVRMMEAFRLGGRILSARVYRQADNWYIAIQAEVDAGIPWVHQHPVVGVDLGVKTAVMPSHGPPADSPNPLRAALQRLGRANRRLHRRKKGGSNRRKARILVAKLHQRIANVRQNFMHKITTTIIRENQTVVIEDLNVQGMLRNHRLARAIADVGFGMFRRCLEYKAAVYGSKVIVADRWFPSSKRCSRCGNVKDELLLSERTYSCERCGLVKDRDKNAAMNLEWYPRLAGNLTPMDTDTATAGLAPAASAVVEVGTNPCSLVSTL